MVSIAVAVAFWDAVTSANAALVYDVAIAIAVSFGDVRTFTLVYGSRSVAHATLVIGAKAVIRIVTYSISVCIVVDDGSRSIRFTRA